MGRINGYIILTILILPLCKNIYSQEVPELITDRPELTITPIVVPINSFQVETGFIYEKQISNEGISKLETINLTLGNTLCRYGLSKSWEFRFGGKYLDTKTTGSEIISKEGIQNLFIGAKYQFRKNQNYISNTGIIFQVTLPFGNNNFRPLNYEPEIILAVDQNVTSAINLGMNFGISNNSNLGKNIYIYSLVLRFDFTKQLGAYVEYFSSYISNFSPQHNLDCGLVYLIKKNIQLDCSIGSIIFSNNPDFFGNVGFSVRVPN